MRSSLETRVGIFVLLALAIFVYMGFQIGAFRFDRSSYNSYNIFFKDISGLTRKAEVKIAGVKVGWVEAITLLADHDLNVEANVMILRDYKLYSDAYGVVRQDGLLGPKYLEIIPGDPLLSPLAAGENLSRPSKAPVAVDEIMRQVKNIASNMEEITDSFKHAVGGVQGKEKMVEIVDNLNRAAERIASFSDTVDRAIGRNEDHIDDFLAIGSDLRRLADKIDQHLLPNIQDGVDQVSGVVDRDFNRIATSLESTSESFDQAAMQAREGLRSFNSVVEKIDQGKGLLGKLINEDDTYRDLKVAVSGLKNYFAKIDRLQIVFDSHGEYMQRPGEHYEREDAKGYFDMRIHPNDDHFYLLELVTSEKGFIDRKEIKHDYLDHTRRPINPDLLTVGADPVTSLNKFAFVYNERILRFDRGAIRFGLQFGKIFENIAFRFGIFETTAGLGVDVDIPFLNDKLRWVTSLEVFDMTGWNRQDDRRPHLKWINRIFLYRNVYANFGADDFVSKENASAFFGLGLRFGDDDIKYLLSSLCGVGSAASFAH